MTWADDSWSYPNLSETGSGLVNPRQGAALSAIAVPSLFTWAAPVIAEPSVGVSQGNENLANFMQYLATMHNQQLQNATGGGSSGGGMGGLGGMGRRPSSSSSSSSSYSGPLSYAPTYNPWEYPDWNDRP